MLVQNKLRKSKYDILSKFIYCYPVETWPCAMRRIFNSPVMYLCLVLGVSTMIMCKYYPLVGSDYLYYLTRMLDTHLFYLKNGIDVQWWTPFFGGGLPSFANPNQIQFSLPQFLLFFVNPWLSIVSTLIIFMAIGYFSTYFLLSKEVNLRTDEAILGAILFCLNAFFILHMSAGHLGYHGFMLLPTAVLLLLNKEQPVFALACGLGCIFAYMVHSSGYFVLVIQLFSVPISLLFICILLPTKQTSFLRIFLIALLGLILGILLSSSKIISVHYFMKHFPRIIDDFYHVGIFSALFGVVFQLFFASCTLFIFETPLAPLVVKVMRAVPILQSFIARYGDAELCSVRNYIRQATGAPYGLWELDIGLSPVVLLLFLMLLVSRKTLLSFCTSLVANKKALIGITFMLCWFSIELSIAKGFFYMYIKHLPFFKSIHVNIRFTSIFILPLNLLAICAWSYMRRNSANKILKSRGANIFLCFLAISAYSFYIMVPGKYALVNLKGDRMNMCNLIGDWKNMKYNYERYKVKRILDVGDTEVFRTNSSSATPIDPIFGYFLETFEPKFNLGPVSKIVDNVYYNITNPASLVFPEENGLNLFELISVDDTENFRKFLNHKPTDWEIPIFQKICHYVSSATFTVILLTLSFLCIRKLCRTAPWKGASYITPVKKESGRKK